MTRQSHPNSPARTPQRGASLIELMVGLTVGMFVVLASVGAMMTTRQGASTTSDSYRVQQAGMTAMRLIGANLRQAGSAELIQVGGANTGVQFGNLDARAAGAASDQLVSGVEGGGTNTDSLTVSYQHRIVGGVDAGVTRDCLGNSPGNVAVRIDNAFAVTQVELRCTGSVNPAAPQALVGDNTRATADVAVEDFQVWYWVEPALIAGSQQRVTAAGVAALGGWGQVRAVELCLQLRGTRADYPVAGQYTNCQNALVNHDGRLHQTFSGTYMIRNAL